MLDRFKVTDDIAVRVAPDDMRFTVENLFQACGMPENDAAQATDVLIYADVRGVDTHGVSNMMRAYVTRFRDGIVNPTPKWQITRDLGAALAVDCDGGLGLAVGPPVMDLAIERAGQYGVGVAVAYNGGHYGAAAYFAHRALDHGMIGISMTSGGVSGAPTGGAEPLLGLNPIAIAAPADEEVPFIFDGAMSSVAGNKIQLLRRMGTNLGPGWVARADGTPIMEEAPVPDKFIHLPLGATRETGSHKGYGLMVMVEILTAILGGDGGGPNRKRRATHFFMALDTKAFTEQETFTQNMDAYLKRLRTCTPAPGVDRVLYSGMPEQDAENDRTANGIPYHPEVIAWFTETCAELGVEHRLPR